MTRSLVVSLCCVAACMLLVLPLSLASADDVATPTTPAPAKIPTLDPQDFELLPMTNVEKMAFAAEHPQIAQRAQVMARRAKRLREQLSKRKNKGDAGSKKITAQIQKLKDQSGDVTAQLLDLLKDKGFTRPVAEAIASCPRGDDRVGRYARSLVLLLPDLEPKQRALLEAVSERMLGGRQALQAQKERLQLASKQAELDKGQHAVMLATFNRQWQQNEQRFWRLVDYVLTEEQRAVVGRSLPGKYREKGNAIEHLFALPNLAPQQFAQIKAILTETEAEASADQATQRRVRAALRNKKLGQDERKALQQEQAVAGKRLGALYLDTAKRTKAVLTADQVQAWEAIPPRLSANDRRERSDQVMKGMPLAGPQRKTIEAMRKAVAAQVREIQKKRREVTQKGADYGADSPQQMMMQTMMAGIQSEGAALGRKFLGEVFLNVLTVDQTSTWVLGRYGRRR